MAMAMAMVMRTWSRHRLVSAGWSCSGGGRQPASRCGSHPRRVTKRPLPGGEGELSLASGDGAPRPESSYDNSIADMGGSWSNVHP